MYQLRTCYVNFAEHLQNCWNVNFIYHDAPGVWSETDWRGFFKQLKAFGYNNVQFWIPPTLVEPGQERERAAEQFNKVIEYCHSENLTANPLITVNTIGAQWYLACPNDPGDRDKILEFWRFYAENLKGVDIVTVFPGDPGGCDRNGCDHNTFLTLVAELAWMLKEKNPTVTVDIGTWGTPFTGWGDDMRHTPGWDGTFAMLIDPEQNDPEIPNQIWNGSEDRAKLCMEDTIRQLELFPKDTIFSVNIGLNPDSEPVGGYDSREWARELAKTHRICSWDYSASEGELICYPHYRVEKFKRKRMMEVQAAPYYGAICYTMSPKLSLLMLYTAAQLMIDPYADGKALAGEFTKLVFGDETIGALMQAFEIVPGWGYEPTPYTKKELIAMLEELIERLEQAKGRQSQLPVFPSAEEYRQTLLWHGRNFLYLLGEKPDREKIREEYRRKALSIYDTIPRSVDERSALSAQGYSQIGREL